MQKKKKKSSLTKKKRKSIKWLSSQWAEREEQNGCKQVCISPKREAHLELWDYLQKTVQWLS